MSKKTYNDDGSLTIDNSDAISYNEKNEMVIDMNKYGYWNTTFSDTEQKEQE